MTERPNIWDVLAQQWGRQTRRQHEVIETLRQEIAELRQQIAMRPAPIIVPSIVIEKHTPAQNPWINNPQVTWTTTTTSAANWCAPFMFLAGEPDLYEDDDDCAAGARAG